MTPERTALALAIARHREAADRVAALTAALPKARDASVAAFVAVEKAEAVLAEARADAPHGYVAALLAAPATAAPSDTLGLAERALADAKAHSALAHAGEDRLKADLASAESRLALTRLGLDEAIRAVVRPSPELATLLADYDVRRVDSPRNSAICLTPRKRSHASESGGVEVSNI
jgi:hypothetical protein